MSKDQVNTDVVFGFAQAVKYILDGHAVRRVSWEDRIDFVSETKCVVPVKTESIWSKHNQQALDENGNSSAIVLPYWTMFSKGENIGVFITTFDDIYANDWCLYLGKSNQA